MQGGASPCVRAFCRDECYNRLAASSKQCTLIYEGTNITWSSGEKNSSYFRTLRKCSTCAVAAACAFVIARGALSDADDESAHEEGTAPTRKSSMKRRAPVLQPQSPTAKRVNRSSSLGTNGSLRASASILDVLSEDDLYVVFWRACQVMYAHCVIALTRNIHCLPSPCIARYAFSVVSAWAETARCALLVRAIREMRDSAPNLYESAKEGALTFLSHMMVGKESLSTDFVGPLASLGDSSLFVSRVDPDNATKLISKINSVDTAFYLTRNDSRVLHCSAAVRRVLEMADCDVSDQSARLKVADMLKNCTGHTDSIGEEPIQLDMGSMRKAHEAGEHAFFASATFVAAIRSSCVELNSESSEGKLVASHRPLETSTQSRVSDLQVAWFATGSVAACALGANAASMASSAVAELSESSVRDETEASQSTIPSPDDLIDSEGCLILDHDQSAGYDPVMGWNARIRAYICIHASAGRLNLSSILACALKNQNCEAVSIILANPPRKMLADVLGSWERAMDVAHATVLLQNAIPFPILLSSSEDALVRVAGSWADFSLGSNSVRDSDLVLLNSAAIRNAWLVCDGDAITWRLARSARRIAKTLGDTSSVLGHATAAAAAAACMLSYIASGKRIEDARHHLQSRCGPEYRSDATDAEMSKTNRLLRKRLIAKCLHRLSAINVAFCAAELRLVLAEESIAEASEKAKTVAASRGKVSAETDPDASARVSLLRVIHEAKAAFFESADGISHVSALMENLDEYIGRSDDTIDASGAAPPIAFPELGKAAADACLACIAARPKCACLFAELVRRIGKDMEAGVLFQAHAALKHTEPGDSSGSFSALYGRVALKKVLIGRCSGALGPENASWLIGTSEASGDLHDDMAVAGAFRDLILGALARGDANRRSKFGELLVEQLRLLAVAMEGEGDALGKDSAVLGDHANLKSAISLRVLLLAPMLPTIYVAEFKTPAQNAAGCASENEPYNGANARESLVLSLSTLIARIPLWCARDCEQDVIVDTVISSLRALASGTWAGWLRRLHQGSRKLPNVPALTEASVTCRAAAHMLDKRASTIPMRLWLRARSALPIPATRDALAHIDACGLL